MEPLEAFKTDFKNPFPWIQREFYRVEPAERGLFVARPGDTEPGLQAGINPRFPAAGNVHQDPDWWEQGWDLPTCRLEGRRRPARRLLTCPLLTAAFGQDGSLPSIPTKNPWGMGTRGQPSGLAPFLEAPLTTDQPSCRGWWCSHHLGSCPRAPAPPEHFAPSPRHRELRAGGHKIKPSFNGDKNCRIMGNRRADPSVRGHQQSQSPAQEGAGDKKSLVSKVIRKAPVVRGHLCLAQPRRGHSRTEVPEVPTPS